MVRPPYVPGEGSREISGSECNRITDNDHRGIVVQDLPWPQVGTERSSPDGPGPITVTSHPFDPVETPPPRCTDK